MAKTGQGFSKLYTRSQNESSYYNGPAMAAQMSAADLTQDGTAPVASDMRGGRGQSVGGGVASSANRRSRPMTAKVKVNNF